MSYSIHLSKNTKKKVSFTFLGLFDQIIHSTENVDIIALFKHLHPKVFSASVLVRPIYQVII